MSELDLFDRRDTVGQNPTVMYGHAAKRGLVLVVTARGERVARLVAWDVRRPATHKTKPGERYKIPRARVEFGEGRRASVDCSTVIAMLTPKRVPEEPCVPSAVVAG